jgi:hypothetical protein
MSIASFLDRPDRRGKLIDGINDQGLYVGLFYVPGYAGYAQATAENRARCLAPRNTVTGFWEISHQWRR